ncbi:MAG: NRAMP family divalent metal transporter [Sedimentisphaerales bacterium]
MKRILAVLFWSVIAAAFIGPGTVTTAASSGASYGYALLWALLFSTIACLILQEASARVAIISGLSLGQAIRKQFYGSVKGFLVLLLIVGAIIFGCAAYEAGNILGGVTGALLGTGLSPTLLTLILGGFAGVILWLGTPRTVAYLLSIIVAFMGIVFFVTAILLKPPTADILQGSFLPTLPHGSGLLVLGLIGTTVVPYNLFLGSGIASGQNLPELRFGLSISIILGGLISMGVLVVGTAVQNTFTFENLASTLSDRLGSWASPLFAFGLCAAGLSSAITAPLAAAITAKSLFAREGQGLWQSHTWRYRSVWLGVLLIGIGFGLGEVRPIPAIILAQALNGVLLPFAAIFLLLIVNNHKLMGTQGMNGLFSNSIMSIVVAVTIVLGISNVMRALASALNLPTPKESIILVSSGLVTAVIAFPIYRAIHKQRGDYSALTVRP